jgi:hypothetical protein
MNSDPVYVTFGFNGNLSGEVRKATLGIKGLRGESADTFKRLPADGNTAFGSLAMSVQQAARGLPAAAMGLNMFFPAISNNIPILEMEKEAAEALKEAEEMEAEAGMFFDYSVKKSQKAESELQNAGISGKGGGETEDAPRRGGGRKKPRTDRP